MERRDNKALNDVRLGQNTRVRNVIRYCNSIIKENNFRELHFSAVGGAIGKLVSTVEVLRIVNPGKLFFTLGFFQVNKIGTVSYQTVDGQGTVTNQRLYPKLEVTLTLDEPKEKGEGFQAILTETERTQLFELHSNRLGGEDRPRGGRGGFRGGRGAPRGRGFRGGRGAPRGRGGFRGDREFVPRGRGGFRGDHQDREYVPRGRGGFRGRPERGPRINRVRGSGRGRPY